MPNSLLLEKALSGESHDPPGQEQKLQEIALGCLLQLMSTALGLLTSNPMSVRRPSDVVPYQDIPKDQDYASTVSGAPK
jgi:hypothetical protein